MMLVILIIGIKLPVAMFAGVILLLLRQVSYGMALSRNHFPFKYIIYYLPAVFLYAGVLWASHESYAKGKGNWKGREYTVGVGASNKYNRNDMVYSTPKLYFSASHLYHNPPLSPQDTRTTPC